jgi:S1-C subfamily serine protease
VNVAPAANPAGFTGAIQSIKRSVIPIVCIAVNGTVAQTLSVEGTGFFVAADGTFITANHVIDGMVSEQRKAPCPHTAFYLPQSGGWSSEQATFQSDYYVFHANECKRDADLDIARCRSVRNVEPAHKIAPVTFETSLQPDGTPVAFTGFPLQFQIPLSSVGNISGYVPTRDDGRGPRSIIMDKEAWPGASGSPLYLANGKVVGLLRRRGVNIGTGRTIGIPSRLIREFLSQ